MTIDRLFYFQHLKDLDMKYSNQQLKYRFLAAVVNGELGKLTERGYTVSLKQFRMYFNDIKTQYVSSFLPAATIEIGQLSISHTKFVFRIKKGVYLVHPDAIEEYKQLLGYDIEEGEVAYASL